jgi:hypothetical protein
MTCRWEPRNLMRCRARDLRKATSLAILVAAALLAWPARSNACSCPGQTALLGWPKPNSVDVPVDSTLAVLTSAASEVQYSLHDAAGVAVPLMLVRVLDASPGCGNGLLDVVFLRPTAPLHASTAYRLTLAFATPGAGTPSTVPSETSFATGVGTRAGTPTPTIDRWLFAQLLDDGSRILQVFASAQGAEPTFLVVKGMPSTVVVSLGPLAVDSPQGVSLGRVDCADLEFVDATGQTSSAEHLCNPEKCERPAVLIGDSCGLNEGGESWDTWQALAGDCSTAAPVAPQSGCSFAPAREEDWPSGLVVFAVLALAARAGGGRGRRRTR